MFDLSDLAYPDTDPTAQHDRSGLNPSLSDADGPDPPEWIHPRSSGFSRMGSDVGRRDPDGIFHLDGPGLRGPDSDLRGPDHRGPQRAAPGAFKGMKRSVVPAQDVRFSWECRCGQVHSISGTTRCSRIDRYRLALFHFFFFLVLSVMKQSMVMAQDVRSSWECRCGQVRFVLSCSECPQNSRRRTKY